jgi:acetyl esterase/lipase
VFRIQKLIWQISEYLGTYFSHLGLLLLVCGFVFESWMLLSLSVLFLIILVSKWYKLKTNLFRTFLISFKSAPQPNFTLTLKNNKKTDFYLVKNPQSPAIIFLFGGGFASGDIKQYSHLNSVFNSLGFHSIQLEYSYLPTHDLDATLAELKNSVQEILSFKNNEFAPSSFILGGRSAGAYLALQVSRNFSSSQISQLLLLYPPVVISQWVNEIFPKLLLPMGWIKDRFFSNQKTERDLTQVQDFSKERTYWLLTGDQDLMVPHHHSFALKAHLENLGCKVNLDIFPAEPHGFEASLNTLGGQKFFNLLADRLSTNSRS